ncbi:MAG: tetratricopeptide repeat protein [Candidatus Glassbacteria bacterium]|nr:tetratricopeptide repeat protein [Candidatus Glassbacteria bacterium]
MRFFGKKLPVEGIIVILTVALFAGCSGGRASNEQNGDRYYRSGQYDDALAEYLMAEKTAGTSAALLRKIGKVYVMQGDFFQAKNYFDRYFSTRDSVPDEGVLLDYFQIAVERGRSGDTTTMVHALEEILAINPSFSLGAFYFVLGDYYFEQSDYHRAIAYYLRGLPLDTEQERRAGCMYNLAAGYEKLEDYFNAFLYYDQFLTLYPDRPESEQASWHRSSCSYPLALQMREEGDLEQAFYYLNLIISGGQPQHLVDDAWYLRGEILLQDNRPAEAKQAFERVLKLNRYYYKEKIAEQARKRIEEIEFSGRQSL